MGVITPGLCSATDAAPFEMMLAAFEAEDQAGFKVVLLMQAALTCFVHAMATTPNVQCPVSNYKDVTCTADSGCLDS